MIFSFGDCELDTSLYELRRRGEACAIEPKAFDLLLFLVKNRDRLVTKDEIHDTIWEGRIVSDATLSSCVNVARRAIGDSGKKQTYIRTLPRRGFRFVADVDVRNPEGERSEADSRSEDNVSAAKSTRIIDPSLSIPDGPSIAVMPFVCISGSLTEDTIAEGLAEDIVTALSKMSNILVISRSSTNHYKDKDVNPQQVSRDQGVRHVLSGAVQSGADRVRVTAQLIDAGSGEQIWADRFDRSRGDFLDLQDEITKEVVSALQVKLTEGEQARVWASGTRDTMAWQNVVRATAKYHSHHRDEIPKARELAIEATRLDPDYPAAWAVLGWTHWVDGRWNWSEDQNDSFNSALDLAHRSLNMDPHLPDGLTLLGVTELHLGHPDEALATFERAILAAPSHANVAALGAYAHCYAGDPARAVALINRAIRLCPSYPVWYLATLARGHWENGETETAIELLREAVRLDPDFINFYAMLASFLGNLGRESEAQPVLGRLLSLDPGFSTQVWSDCLPIRDPTRLKREVSGLIRIGAPS
jgi:TolB-like protein/cytochrome c-type biogenesis protein CcmH/NrfG